MLLGLFQVFALLALLSWVDWVLIAGGISVILLGVWVNWRLWRKS